MIQYDEFVNEMAKVSDIKVGDYVYCNGDFHLPIRKTKGKFAKVIKISKEKDGYNNIIAFTLEFDELIAHGHYQKRSKTTKITSYQLKMLDVMSPEEYEKNKKLIDSGVELLKYEASKTFNDIIKKIKFKITSIYLNESYFDIIKEKNDMVSYLPFNKLKSSKELEEDPYQSKFRQITKIGRIFRKLNEKLTDVEIEKFVDEYKASYESMFKEYNVKIVTGNDITYWYHVNQYAKGSGSLNKSCMRHTTATTRVGFYSKYPDKIGLAILVDENEKLLARALIWKLDEPKDVIFMDRIYSTKALYTNILKNYAIKNGIKTRSEGYNIKTKMVVEIPSYKNENLPYMDTFYLARSKKELTNKG